MIPRPLLPTDSSSDTAISGCYSDVGEDYRGQIKVSQSGKQCLQWNVVGSYEARHSYCRNYGGKREAPWCYVSKDKKEYCDIPKCRLSGLQHFFMKRESSNNETKYRFYNFWF